MTTQLHDLTALEQADAIRRREVSPTDLVEHYLQRIEQLNPQLRAFVRTTPETARAGARAAERAVLDGHLDGRELPPLHGVPTAIKDLNMVAGVPIRFGSAALPEMVAPLDDHVVTLLKQAGAVSLGKTATPEFGLPCYTETDFDGATVTPWDTSRTAGGSSGGAAAAVAAGLVPFAQGSDGGGSIRIPASCCGIFGLKTTRGRVSNGPLMGDLTGLAWNGPLARTVADAAAMLDAMAVPMPGDPHSQPPPAESFLSATTREPDRLRIGRFSTPVIAETPVHPECLAAWDDATLLLSELGHQVEDVTVPLDPGVVASFEDVWTAATTPIPVPPDSEERLRPLTRWLRERGRQVSATRFLRAMAGMQAATRQLAAATQGYDLLLSPTLAMPPVAAGWFTEPGDPAEDFERQKRFTPYTSVYNVSGQPAASLPLHWTPEGLPVGVMLAAPYGREDLLLSVCAEVERARPWRDRTPPGW